MKVDKFDYKKYKNIILDTIRDLDDQEKIQIKSFTSKYYQLDFGDVKKQIKILIRDLQHQGVDLSKFMKDYKDQIYKKLIKVGFFFNLFISFSDLITLLNQIDFLIEHLRKLLNLFH